MAKHPLEDAVIRLCNEHRAQHGARPLHPSCRLRMAANAHAKDMMKRGYFSHQTKGGASWDVRIRRIIGTSYAALAENIAFGQDDPAEVVRAWMATAATSWTPTTRTWASACTSAERPSTGCRTSEGTRWALCTAS